MHSIFMILWITNTIAKNQNLGKLQIFLAHFHIFVAFTILRICKDTLQEIRLKGESTGYINRNLAEFVNLYMHDTNK